MKAPFHWPRAAALVIALSVPFVVQAQKVRLTTSLGDIVIEHV